jgi:DNA invertase Pin-like site-specific DNA recombinase
MDGGTFAQDRERIAREPAYHYVLRKEFEEHGCKIRALNDRGDESPEGELTDGILDQLAPSSSGRRRRSAAAAPQTLGALPASHLLHGHSRRGGGHHA